MLFYDKCGVSPEYVADSIFKMKGKKYLDVYKCPTTIQTSIVSIPNESYYDMSTSSMLSSLTFGFLGSSTASAAISLASNKRSSTNLSSTTTSPQPQPTVVTAKPIVSPNPGNSFKPLYGQLLFVQDRSNLLLIRPEVPPVSTHKPGEKIRGTFIVHISAPLIQTDVSVDPINKCIMKIIVKSWQLPQPNMEIITLDKIYHPTSLPSTIDVTTSPNKIYQNRIITKSPTFLNPLVHSTLYQINIGFEYAQACSLAVEHIVSRRKAIRSDKIKQLKKAFQSWLSMNPTE